MAKEETRRGIWRKQSVYVFTFIATYVYTRIHIHTCLQAGTCTYACMHATLHLCIGVHMVGCMSAALCSMLNLDKHTHSCEFSFLTSNCHGDRRNSDELSEDFKRLSDGCKR